MACFVVPVTEAVVTTVAQRIMKAHEKEEKLSPEMDCAEGVNKIPFSVKLGWLNRLLWGGSALLAFEHLWHGEIVPFFPFLTAVADGEAGGNEYDGRYDGGSRDGCLGRYAARFFGDGKTYAEQSADGEGERIK